MTDYTDYPLLRHNTFGIAARCRRFIEYTDPAELRAILADLRACPDEPFFHIGGGSNLLFTRDYPGTILHSAIRGREIRDLDDGRVALRAGAGEDWDELVAFATAAGCYGLENLSLIPGEVGASAVQNIGAYGLEAGRCIMSVEAIEVATGSVRTFTPEECRYAYRYSIFKGELRGRYVITHVTYTLSRQFVPHLEYAALRREIEARRLTPGHLTAEQVRDIIVEVRRAKLPDPQEVGSAGSFFMNPVVSKAKFQALCSEYPAMPHYPAPDGIKIPAGWLIEQCGWKGRTLGRAGVYEKQALVLVNRGEATGEEIVRLAEQIQEDVARRFGIAIHPEVNYL